MKITFIGYDYTLDIAERLKEDGHDILHMFTFPCDGCFSFNTQMFAFADSLGIPITDAKIEPQHINDLVKQGCDMFVCAGYLYKIPPLPEGVFGINHHPALLPRGRGIMPLSYIIMEDQQAAGFTLHKLAPTYDSGDILFQQAITINESTSIETLSAKIAIHAPEAISTVVSNIKHYWAAAIPQDHSQASSYPAPNDDMRSLSWHDTAKDLNLKGNAFGRFGTFAMIRTAKGIFQKLLVFHFTAWEEKHHHRVGALLRSSSNEIIVAINEGYICLEEFQLVQP